MKLSVVVCTLPERLVYLSSLLANLHKQTHPPDEVIIVTDEGQSDLIEDVFSSRSSFELLRFILRIRILESGGKGLSKARNRGVEAAIGDIVLFIDDDVVLSDRNILFRVMEAFEEDGRLGVYGVQVKPVFHKSRKLPDKFNWIYGCTDDKAVRPVGAFFAVRRVIFNIVGLFDTDLGRKGKGNLVSGEETELFNRVEKQGWKVVLDNRFRVHHIVEGATWRYILKRAYYEGISKAKFSGYNYSAEKKYLMRYLKDPVGWIVAGATGIGFIVGKVKA